MKICVQFLILFTFFCIVGCSHTIRYSALEDHRVPNEKTVRQIGPARHQIELANAPDPKTFSKWDGNLEISVQSAIPHIKDVTIETQRQREFVSWHPGGAIIGRAIIMPFALIGSFFKLRTIHDHDGDGEISAIDEIRDWIAIFNFFEASYIPWGKTDSEMVTVRSRVEQEPFETKKPFDGADIIVTLRTKGIEKAEYLKTDRDGRAKFKIKSYLPSITAQTATVDIRMDPSDGLNTGPRNIFLICPR